ncbi:probable membrane-associated kinase regulator 4 [Solanum dulcamara]|uniref:probable membrane-associated kinase regulator 4 n=1 Tax=Solanum dulcamara TaxID=45834 RepID=UPI0024861892|nr:probable membrane-associated kinase regulator 4 [Solanum dulcamara]
MEYAGIRRSCDNVVVEEEDYIDMEVSSNSNIFSHFKNSPSQTREFEFQMFPNSIDKDTTTSPADELFHNGKLLPLHLPFGTTQMVEKLLQNPNKIPVHGTRKHDVFDESFSTPLFTTTTNTPTSNNTPFESCNISPVESCQVSRELNLDEYMFEYNVNNLFPVDDENRKSSWTRKLKQIKNSSLGSKLKSSRTYLKSFFSKSGCSNEYSAAASRNIEKGPFPIVKEAKKEPFGQIHRGSANSKGVKKENDHDQDIRGRHRRSFSGAIKRFSTAKSSSSSFSSSTSGSLSASSSNNSNEFQEMHFFKRSTNSYSDIENSIQAAIAHCKNSQHSRKTISDIGVCSLSASKVIIEEQERPGLCRG